MKFTMKKCRFGRKIQSKAAAKEIKNGVSDSCISVIPASLLLEIFVRLPIINLMACKAVCKAWNNLISDSNFADYYGSNSSFTHLVLPFKSRFDFSTFQFLFLLEITENGCCTVTPIKLKLPGWLVNKSSSEFVIGSCNGLLSLSIYKPGFELIYISNPITRECIELPKHERVRDDRSLVDYKIGYCPLIDKFKVLKIACKRYNDSKEEHSEIFTVGVDDRWRRLSNQFTGLCVCADWISLDGAFHWILQDSGCTRISTFNIAQEKVGKILHPPGLALDSKTMKLALVNKRLSLLDCSVPSQLGIWTLTTSEIGKSWTKDVILSSWFPSGIHVSKLIPVEKLRNGDILFGHSADLISFSAKQKKCSKVFSARSIASRLVTYTPSFQSLKEAVADGAP